MSWLSFIFEILEIPRNTYNKNGLFLCLKKHISLYSFKMNDMSKLIKHVREAPTFFYSFSVFSYIA